MQTGIHHHWFMFACYFLSTLDFSSFLELLLFLHQCLIFMFSCFLQMIFSFEFQRLISVVDQHFWILLIRCDPVNFFGDSISVPTKIFRFWTKSYNNRYILTYHFSSLRYADLPLITHWGHCFIFLTKPVLKP